MDQFQIPVVLFFFKREEKTLQIIDRISQVRPRKLYLISDGARNEDEANQVTACRKSVEEKINWECEVVKNYAEENKGVYDRIGKGALWVLSREDSAIFLEDDNLPEITFFRFCEEMLNRYRDDTRILWVCGTNYIEDYTPPDGSSYVFTKHMLPCGWASWNNKFPRFYDGEFKLWKDPYVRGRVKKEYYSKPLLKQDMQGWDRECRRIERGESPGSWDAQMRLTQRMHGLYGIVPKYNQITNIGVDVHSIHGGSTYENIMTRRFCGLKTKPLNFPLVHPKIVLSDIVFEKRTDKIVLFPLKYRVKGYINRFLKKILSIDQDESLVLILRKKIHL